MTQPEWAKFTVEGHRCRYLKHDPKGNLLPFYATTAVTAAAFCQYWGGKIKKLT